MKKIVFLCILSLAFMHELAFAGQKKLTEKEVSTQKWQKWVALAWKDGEKPIVMPVLSDTEKDCLKFVKEMNDIAKNTVKVDRQVSCQPVMVK